MTRAELKSTAKEQLKGNVGRYFLCSLVVMVGYFLVVNIPMKAVTKKIIRDAFLGRTPNLLPLYGIIIIAALITAPLQLSFAKIDLGVTKNEKVQVSGLIEGYKRAVSSIGLTLLMKIFVFLWSLLLVIPGIIKSLSYSLSFYILAENPEMSAIDALNESKEMMKGHKWELFVLGLSFILWVLLGVVTLGLAFIYVIPYMRVTMANFYNSIKPDYDNNYIGEQF